MVESLIFAFITCGTFCLIGQIIYDNSKLSLGHITSLLVVIGAILEFFDLYKYIRKFGQIGASLPISSFGSLIMKGVKESIDNYGFIGVFQGVFDKCGTLIAFCIFIAFISTLFFKPKS